MIAIHRANPRDFVSMLQAGDAYAASLYPAESNHMLDVNILLEPAMHFFGIWQEQEKLGCGGFWAHSDYVEIKRVWIEISARRLGLSKRLMLWLEAEALALGYNIVRLETGVKQPEAIGLYRSLGYGEISPFGDYKVDPNSVFMEKILSAH